MLTGILNQNLGIDDCDICVDGSECYHWYIVGPIFLNSELALRCLDTRSNTSVGLILHYIGYPNGTNMYSIAVYPGREPIT